MNQGLRLPLNINDDQMYPSMSELPTETEGWTEMTFFLVQAEACWLLHPVIGNRGHSPTDTITDITEKRKFIEERCQNLLNRYDLASERPSSELSRLAFQHLTTARYKMDFILRLREELITRKQGDAQKDDDGCTHRLSFKIACDELESHCACKKDMKFKWLFTAYTQWYALAYVLRCLCNVPNAPDTDYVWSLIEDAFPDYMHQLSTTEDGKEHATIWKCLSLLRHQALLLRSSQLGIEASQIEMPTRNSTIKNPIFESAENTVLSLDFLSSDPQFLSDWNAVINSCFVEGDGMGMMT
jgi:hypothetical protein